MQVEWHTHPIVLFCVLDHWELLQWDMDQQVFRVHLSKYFNGAVVTLCRHFLCGRNVWLLLCWTFCQPLWQVWPATLSVILLTMTIPLMSPIIISEGETPCSWPMWLPSFLLHLWASPSWLLLLRCSSLDVSLWVFTLASPLALCPFMLRKYLPRLFVEH